MALVRCPECGNKVSSSAKSCMNCGYPVKEILSDIDRKRNRKRKRELKRIITIAGVVVGVIAIALIFRALWPKSNPFYYEISWGTSFQDTLSKLRSKYGEKEASPSEDGDISIWHDDNYLNIDGLTGIKVYKFTDDKLSKVYVMLMTDESKIDNYDLNRKVEEALSEYYEASDDSSEYKWVNKDTKVFFFSSMKTAGAITFIPIDANEE